jgi:tight adherence protein B
MGVVLTPVALALIACLGVHLLYTSLVFDWKGLRLAPSTGRSTPGLRSRVADWLVQVGLDDVAIGEFGAVVGTLFALGATAGYVMFGGPLSALMLGVFSASFPVAAYRRRRTVRRNAAMESWPRLIEEIRILTSSLGRSIPQALFEVGARSPDELRPAFEAAHREWLLTTDFERTLHVLRSRLADPTADATCETLLIAHQVGGADLEARLAALADDRRQDVRGRKDAKARQAGVRFARRFVLIVPFGMALAGMSVGTGRSAYQTPTGQMIVIVGLLMVVGCWLWAGQLMKLPETDRVFPE